MYVLLKRIDVFMNQRQMTLLNHQKRLDDLQQDLMLSECQTSNDRLALQNKDVEVSRTYSADTCQKHGLIVRNKVNQLHHMLNHAEQTAQHMTSTYNHEIQTLKEQVTINFCQ
jgi:hypothetical protein